MTTAEQERAAVLCALWIYREGLAFRVAESDAIKKMTKAMNPAFVPRREAAYPIRFCGTRTIAKWRW